MIAQTSAQLLIADDVIDVRMSLADGISHAQTIRTLVRSGRVPPGVGDVLNRVASQILAEARLKIAQQKGGR